MVVLPPTRAVDPDTELAHQFLPNGTSAQSAASQAEEGSAPVPVNLQKASPGLMSSAAPGGGTACKPRSWRLLPLVLLLVLLLAISLPLVARLPTVHWLGSLAEKTTRTLLVFKQVRCHPPARCTVFTLQ